MKAEPTRVPLTEARNILNDLSIRVTLGKERIILTKHGKDFIELVPPPATKKAKG